MIGTLRGKLTLKQPPTLIIEAAGVGYEVQAPMSTYYGLPAVGAELFLVTHLIVREDARELYGFGTTAERDLFRALIRISGVGGRMALTILSGMSVSEFAGCVQRNDTATLIKVPGVGKKTAERLIVEMSDRVAVFTGSASGTGSSAPTDAPGEAFSALVALGYKPAEVTRMLSKIEKSGLSTEDIIRTALQAQAEH